MIWQISQSLYPLKKILESLNGIFYPDYIINRVDGMQSLTMADYKQMTKLSIKL